MSSDRLTLRERVLYHQIHPLKLVTDWITGFAAAWLLWNQQFITGLVVGLVPPVIASAILVRCVDLRRLKETALGQYVARSMTRAMEALRLAGAVLFWFGAWSHQWWLMLFGIGIILAAWLRGKLLPGTGLT